MRDQGHLARRCLHSQIVVQPPERVVRRLKELQVSRVWIPMARACQDNGELKKMSPDMAGISVSALSQGMGVYVV